MDSDVSDAKSDATSASALDGAASRMDMKRLFLSQVLQNRGRGLANAENVENTENTMAVLTVSTTEEALRHGIRFGNRLLRVRATSRTKNILLEVKVDAQESVFEQLTPQQLRLFVTLLHGRMRAALLPGASAWVSCSRLLQAAGGLDEKKFLTDDDLDPQTRGVNFPNYLRGPLRQLRQRLQRYGVYVYPLGAAAGRAAGYQLLVQEEFRFATDTPDPWEIDDDALLAFRSARC